jgi:hypothetical protein
LVGNHGPKLEDGEDLATLAHSLLPVQQRTTVPQEVGERHDGTTTMRTGKPMIAKHTSMIRFARL